ncbi:ankyrin repeat domain-containing protein 40-like [Limulus polyphemus]|uniref:Ankyrin repeat domain-containing protein 40-like n=1 Tax=Limulus polyphemus TaxID=6850 RepID=A0ABM1TAM2_LIMPO|nr:ankyrin repeat domain-containing protein 40-like [Limulus polyphemus]
MELQKSLEDKLREAACYGDEESIRLLLSKGVNINTQHDINGWTPLHWAAKRGHAPVVKYLLSQGAETYRTSNKGETPAAVAMNEEIRSLLGGDKNNSDNKPTLAITPGYIAYPPLAYQVDTKDIMENCNVGNQKTPLNTCEINHFRSALSDKCDATLSSELVLKVRVAYLDDLDFIEIDLPVSNLTFKQLVDVCCRELGISSEMILKIRKLPNTIIRKDKDVQRLQNFQEIEIVLEGKNPCAPGDKTSNFKYPEFVVEKHNPSALTGAQTQSPNTNFMERSRYCMNGRILY